jgi:hypothetical protein
MGKRQYSVIIFCKNKFAAPAATTTIYAFTNVGLCGPIISETTSKTK